MKTMLAAEAFRKTPKTLPKSTVGGYQHSRIEKLAFTITEAADVSSLGQTSLYKAIKEKRLISRKYGSRTIITRDDLASFLDSLPVAC